MLRGARDLGLAAWFGGSLMGAVGLDGTAAQAPDRVAAARITSTGWARWTPIGFATIGLHLAGALGTAADTRRDHPRLPALRRCRRGGPAGLATGLVTARIRTTPVIAAVTGAAMVASTHSYVVGKQIQHAALGPDAAQGRPDADTEADLGPRREARLLRAERGLGVSQWAVPALTATLIVLYARADLRGVRG